MKSIQSTLSNALKQLHADRSRIDRQIAALTSAIGALGGEKAPGPRAARRRRKMSAAEKRAVSQRMKAYWAKRRSGK